MTVEIRTVSAEDWRLWRSVRLTALADAPRAFGSRLSEWVDASEARWRERLSIPGALDLLAVDLERGVPIGMATGVPGPHGADHAGVISMWVDPSARGLGVADALLEAIARWAGDAGAASLVLSVMPDNLLARRAYERAGFVVSEALGDPLPDGGYEVVMIRDLRADEQRRSPMP